MVLRRDRRRTDAATTGYETSAGVVLARSIVPHYARVALGRFGCPDRKESDMSVADVTRRKAEEGMSCELM